MPYREHHWCKWFHTMVVCLVLHLSMPRVQSRESAHARQKYATWKKQCGVNVFSETSYLPVKLFRPTVDYYSMDIHILIVMCIPNPVYNSLDVRYTVFSYNYKFRERDDVGATVKHNSMHFWGESCKLWYNYQTCMWHFYSYQIHSVRLANRKSKMAAIFQDGHEQINCTLHKAGPNWPNSSTCVSKWMFWICWSLLWMFHNTHV